MHLESPWVYHGISVDNDALAECLRAALQLMHSLMTEVFTKKPENSIDFMIQWLEKEKERRVEEKLAAMQ